ncbi:MAG: 23S rRNA (pseudouridine(1915)-N(3))-methyltransferase RlmH [Clostridia bacterium]|nr:23S rRNA (pseudouridine(1915)-N(3))-methyltransferase RlmH [Clostridia bacterium]
MLHINIICIGKLKEKYLQDAIVEYTKRLSKYCIFNITELPDEKIPDSLNKSVSNIIKDKEAEKIICHIEKNSYVLTLDLNGRQFTSEEFSKKIENISLNSSSNITFIIGGTLGLSEKVIKCSNELISFSKMTFPHQLIRIFLAEQLFRAFKISNNETYHR